MRAASRLLFCCPFFRKGFVSISISDHPLEIFVSLLLLAVGVVVFFDIIPHFGSVLFLLFGLARLAEQLLRTCRRSYCPKFVKRIAKNRNYLLWAFCSFFGWSFSFVLPHFPCVLVLVLGGGVPVEEQGTSFGVIIGKNL